jgi:hypothetical protein
MAEQLDPEKLKEAEELARKLGIAFDASNRSAKDLEATIRGFKEQLKENNRELNTTYDYFRNITNELKKTDIVTNDIKKGYSGLTSVAQTLQQVQLGNQNISLKDISSLREKINLNKNLLNLALDTRKRDEEALISKIAAEKQISTDQVKAAFDAQKSLSDNIQQQEKIREKLNSQKKISGAVIADYKAQLINLQNGASNLEKQVNLLGGHRDKLNELNSLRKEEENRQESLNSDTQILLDKLKEEEDRQKRINNLLGLGGNTIDFASQGMDKLGLGGLKTYLNFDQAKKAMADTAEKIDKGVISGNKLSVLSVGLKGLFSGLGKALLDPLTIMLTIIDAFKSTDKATGDLAKEFNKTYKQASNLREELINIANSSNDINVTTKGLQESMVAVGKSLGTNAMLNKEDLVTFTKLREQAGYTNDELVGIQQLSLVNGKTLEDNTKEILGGAQAYAAQNKFVVNEKEVLREVSKTSAAIKLTLGGSAEAVAKAVVQAKQFGLNLQQAEQISKSLLQFEDSISSELEAEILTGKQFNFERARSLALQGKIAEAAAEVAKQVGTAAQFGKMNVIQQEALAKSVGMTREDLAKSLMDREALTKLSAKEGETAQQAFNRLVKEVGLEKAKEQLGNEQLANQFAQQSVQERFNATIEKLKEIFVSLVQPLLPVLDVFANIFKIVGPIVGFVGKIAGFLGNILGFLSPIITTTLVWKGLTGSIGKSIWSAVKGMGAIFTTQSRINIAKNLGFITDKQATLQQVYANQLANQGMMSEERKAYLKGKTLFLAIKENFLEGSKNAKVKISAALEELRAANKGRTAAAENAVGLASLKTKAQSVGGFLLDVGKYALKAGMAVAGIPVVGPVLAIGAITAALAGGMALYSKFKGNDIVSQGYGKRTLLAPEGSIALNDKDTVIAGTKLFGDDAISEPGKNTELKPKGSITSNVNTQVDLSPLIAEMQSMKNILNQILSKEGTVYLDGNKVGTTLTTGFSTFKSQ